MSPRAGGFVAMIATALLLLGTLAPIPVAGQTNAWWSGHPSVDGGKPIEAKEVNIALFTSKGCNTGGDGACQPVPLGSAFRGVRYAELGLTSLLALATLLLGIMCLRIRPSRARLAKLVMVAAMIAAVGSIVLLVMGPDIKSSKPVAVPMGPGLILFFIGTALAIGSSVIALLPYHQPLPKRLTAPPAQMPAQVPGFDVDALLAEDALRPSQMGIEPMMGRPQSPGGALPGPAGPLGSPSGSQPLFQSAPQLRPLYEMNGAGYTPPAPQPAQFPTRPPTPISHAAVNAALGLDTPAVGSPMVGSTRIPVPAIPAPPKLPPPPSRTKSMSAPPLPGLAKRPPPPATRPPPPVSKPPGFSSRPPPGSPTMMSAAVPPPPRASADDLLKTADFEKSLSTGDSTDNLDAEMVEVSESSAKAIEAGGPAELPFDSSTAENSTSAFERDDKPELPFDTSTAENSTKAFSADENTDVGEGHDDLETAARDKVDNTQESAIARSSFTEVEISNRHSGTEVELGAVPRQSTSSVISSAAPPSRANTPVPGTNVPMSTAPDSLPPPTEAPVAAGPSPACPQCEAPMRWVEEHLRFFCKSCRMYF